MIFQDARIDSKQSRCTSVTQKRLAFEAARHARFDLLRWLYANKRCVLDSSTYEAAISSCSLEILQWLAKNIVAVNGFSACMPSPSTVISLCVYGCLPPTKNVTLDKGIITFHRKYCWATCDRWMCLVFSKG